MLSGFDLFFGLCLKCVCVWGVFGGVFGTGVWGLCLQVFREVWIGLGVYVLSVDTLISAWAVPLALLSIFYGEPAKADAGQVCSACRPNIIVVCTVTWCRQAIACSPERGVRGLPPQYRPASPCKL